MAQGRFIERKLTVKELAGIAKNLPDPDQSSQPILRYTATVRSRMGEDVGFMVVLFERKLIVTGSKDRDRERAWVWIYDGIVVSQPFEETIR